MAQMRMTDRADAEGVHGAAQAIGKGRRSIGWISQHKADTGCRLRGKRSHERAQRPCTSRGLDTAVGLVFRSHTVRHKLRMLTHSGRTLPVPETESKLQQGLPQR
jgi:hypothetical protein